MGVASVALVLAAGAVACSDDEHDGAASSTTTAAGATADGASGPGSTTAATLPFDSVTRDELAEAAELDLPAGTADFLTARLPDRSQLDVTFTVATDEAQGFVTGSGLPTPVAGDRMILHASPLWELNPGSEIRGAQDTVPGPDGVDLRRAVELVDEDGRVRVRMVITPA